MEREREKENLEDIQADFQPNGLYGLEYAWVAQQWQGHLMHGRQDISEQGHMERY